MEFTVKEKILFGAILLVIFLTPIPLYLGMQARGLIKGDGVIYLHDVIPPTPTVYRPPQINPNEIISRVRGLNIAGEYGKSLDLLDDAGMKKFAGTDMMVKKIYLETYDLHIDNLIRDGEYTEAVRVLENKVDVDPEHTEEINAKILDTYFLRMERDKSKHFFKEALDTINSTLPKYSKYDTDKRIEKEKKAIYSAMSVDSGVDGRNALEESIRDVCGHGHATSKEYLPYLGTDTSHKKIIDCDQRLTLDDSMAARTLSEFAYILDFHVSHKSLAPCYSSDGRVIDHVQEDWTVGLVDIKTGKVVYRKDFPGVVTSCPATLKHILKENVWIDLPDEAAVTRYLRSVLKMNSQLWF
jgi:hypothetical protein